MLKQLRRVAAVGVIVAAALVVPTTTASAAGPPLYNSGVTPGLVGNVPSEGPEAYAFNELGNEVNLTGNKLGNVVVTMSSWGCQTGHWYSHDCGTTPGSTFTEPITFNIYNPPALGSYTPGALIATKTLTFSLPYRPSANFTHCSGSNAGKWWNNALATCFNGKAVNITFPFFITLPTTDVVFGISYNTSDYGYSPYGQATNCFTNTSGPGCPYDSLNIGLTQDPTNVIAGSDRYPGTVYQNSPIGGQYCDAGAAGVGVFRLDSPNVPSCWSVGAPGTSPYYIPAVQLKHS